VAQLPQRPAELDRDQPTALLCHSGSRISLATRMAAAAGLDAANVAGEIVA
jgi:rhodanese-related sulfurtransferase